MKIKWSGLGMTDGSGKIGGNVAGKNRFGNYLRRKGQVLNPQTIAQQARRMAFGALSQAWRALTNAQRAAWSALAPFLQVFDQFGDAITLTGAQLYVRLNANLALIAEAAIDDAPVPAGAAQLDPAVITMDIGTGDAFTWNQTNFVNSPIQDSKIVLEATPPVSAGRTEGSIKNLFRVITVGASLPFSVIQTADGTPIAYTDATFAAGIAANYGSVFGIPAEGQKVFFRTRAVNENTGESSPIIMTSTIVTDTP